MNYVIKYAVLPSSIIENTVKPSSARIGVLDKQMGFFAKLEKSILRDGFRNPIVISASKKKITTRYGGSRLMVAQKHNLHIPCIIADFDELFPDAVRLNGEAEIRKYYTDQPRKILIKEYGINMSGCEHVHLNEEVTSPYEYTYE